MAGGLVPVPSVLYLISIALIAFGLFGLWRARQLAPEIGRELWARRDVVPRLLRNLFVSSERPPRAVHAWQKPRIRITWIARTALYPTLVAAVVWQWNGRAGLALYASDLDVEASAPRQVPADAPLPLRVAASPFGGGTVPTDVHWSAFGEGDALLAAGDATCVGSTTILLPDAHGVRAVEIRARGPKGEQSLRLDRTLPLPGAEDAIDRAHTRCRARAHVLVKTAERQQRCVWMVSLLGLVLVGLWVVAEGGAWLARRALRAAATLPRQVLGAALVVLPIAMQLWSIADARFFSWAWCLPLDEHPRH